MGVVTGLNFFFAPPRFTFELESREHLITPVVMLVVALVISHLDSGLRRESLYAALSAQRARQLQSLAYSLADTAAQHDKLMHVAAAGTQTR